MGIQIPFGMRDYLPDDCYNKKLLESRIAEVFDSYGYQQVSAPVLEYFDNSFAGDIKAGNKMFKLTDYDGSLLVLRPDATLQICRMYVANLSGIQRLYYKLDSFEYLSDENSARDREFAQMGVELLGDSGKRGEAELIAMAIDALQGSGLKDFTIDIGHVGYFEGLVEESGLSAAEVRTLKGLINKKDMLGVETFFSAVDTSEVIKDIFMSLPLLFGDATVLKKASMLCANEKSRRAVAYLSDLARELTEMGLGKNISIDLGLLSSNDYYTGVVFKGLASGVGTSVLDGGRYDRLCDRMGKPTNAIGFAIGIGRTLKALKQEGQWKDVPAPDIAFTVLDCKAEKVRRTVARLRKKQSVLQYFGDEMGLIEFCKKRGIAKALIFDADDFVEITVAQKGDER